MTELQTMRTRALAAANLGQNHRALSFIKDLERMIEHAPDRKLTPRQAGYLLGLSWSFRRQIPAALRPAQNPFESQVWSQREDDDENAEGAEQNITAETFQMEEL
jgi:hypothetical protein